MKTIARPFRLARFSAAWTDAPFYYLPVGERRAKRFSRWLRAGGKLPRPGNGFNLEVTGHGWVCLKNVAGKYEMHGGSAVLDFLRRAMLDQERVERRR